MPVEFHVLPYSLRMEIAMFFAPHGATRKMLAKIRMDFSKLAPTQANRIARMKFEIMAATLARSGALRGIGEYFAPAAGMGEYFAAQGLGADAVVASDDPCAAACSKKLMAVGAVGLGVGLAVALVALR
jgi:hypothetical protein